MDWQQLISLVIVAGATLFLIRRTVRKGTLLPTGCEGNCRCSPHAERADRLESRRHGETPPKS